MNPIIKAYHCSSVPVCSLLLLIVPVGVVLLLLLLLLMLLLVLLRRRRDDVEGGPVLLGVNSIALLKSQQTFQHSFYSSVGHPVVLETLLKSLLRFQQSY